MKNTNKFAKIAGITGLTVATLVASTGLIATAQAKEPVNTPTGTTVVKKDDAAAKAEAAVKKADEAKKAFDAAQAKNTELNNAITAAQNKVKSLTEAVKGDKKVVDELKKLVKDPNANTDEAKRLREAKAQLAQHEKDLKAATEAQDKAYEALDEYQTGKQFEARIAFNKATEAAQKAVEPLFTAAQAKLNDLDAAVKKAVKNNEAADAKVKDLTAKLAAKPDDAKLKGDLDLAKSQANAAKDAVVAAQTAKTAYEQGKDYTKLKAAHEKVAGYAKTLTVVDHKTPGEKPTPAPNPTPTPGHGLFDGVNIDDVLNYHMNPLNTKELEDKETPQTPKIDVAQLLGTIDGLKAAGYKLTPVDVSELVAHTDTTTPPETKHTNYATDAEREALAKEADAAGLHFTAKLIRASKHSTKAALENLLAEAKKAAQNQQNTNNGGQQDPTTHEKKFNIHEVLGKLDADKVLENAAKLKLNKEVGEELVNGAKDTTKTPKKTPDTKKTPVVTPAKGLAKTGVVSASIALGATIVSALGVGLKRLAKKH